MKILHISTMSKGGAFLAVSRLNNALNSHSVDSRILVLENPDVSSDAIPYIKHSNSSFYRLFYKIKKGVLYRLKIGIGKYWRIHDTLRRNEPCIYSFPLSTFRVEKHRLVKNWADIIHLHWCNNFINYPTFFASIKKPIVWTLHDISFKYGGFHFECDFIHHHHTYFDLENALYKIKEKSLYSKTNITLLALSEEIKHEIESIPYLSNKKIVLLPNIINFDDYFILDKYECRKKLNLTNDKVILFVSENVDTESKGLSDLKKALDEIYEYDIVLCIVGNYIKKDKDHKFNSFYTGKITDSKVLNQYYSAADLLVIPSHQESFALTAFESMASGTPVVSYPCGATTNYINDINGIICETKDPNELKKCILKALVIKYDAQLIRDQIVNRLNPKKIVEDYVLLYNELIKPQK